MCEQKFFDVSFFDSTVSELVLTIDITQKISMTKLSIPTLCSHKAATCNKPNKKT